MSMKRSHSKSKAPQRPGAGDEARSPFGKKAPPAEPEKTWEEWTAEKPESAFVPYSLQSKFAAGMLVSHSKFGKGAVVAVSGGTIDVLFEEGKKRLGHTP